MYDGKRGDLNPRWLALVVVWGVSMDSFEKRKLVALL